MPMRTMNLVCLSPSHQLELLHNTSFVDCLARCNAHTRCQTVGYHFLTNHCRLLSGCNERSFKTTSYGRCVHGWMMMPMKKAVAWLAKFKMSIHEPGHKSFMWCHFTRASHTSVTSSAMRRSEYRATVWRRAEKVRAELAQRHPNARVCGAQALTRGQEGEVIGSTMRKPWRYYTALMCGDAQRRRMCLLFKKTGSPTGEIGGLFSVDGYNFENRSVVLGMPTPWREDMFVHNLAILALGTESGDYAMVGGTQGFALNTSCQHAQRQLRRAAGVAPRGGRASCLKINTRDMDLTTGAATLASPIGATGIRLSIGRGLPWSNEQWSFPRRVISGDSPGGCVDRRPRYTGFPHLHACQFDGRLSLTRDPATDGYLLYARANLRFGAVSGGRFVQVTSSSRLEDGWAHWQPVSILGVDPDSMDIYFFAVQTNPVDASSLLALFPLTEPPYACTALAVSRDGVHFSRPINVRQAYLGVRTDKPGKDTLAKSYGLEWRSEDHPVAGALRAPADSSRVLLYIHHAVGGTTIRESAVSHVRAYSVSAEVLKQETKRALIELGHAG